MKISELQIGQGKADVEGEIVEVGEAKTFNKFGKDLRVANATIKDDSGEVTLTLWNEDIEKVKKGDKVKVSNGYVNQFNGEKQLTSGKFGQIEVEGEEPEKEEENQDKKQEEKKEE